MPYLPIVNAMAPKAPTGATFMITPTMPNSTCETMSMKFVTGLPRSPSDERANANKMVVQNHLSRANQAPFVRTVR